MLPKEGKWFHSLVFANIAKGGETRDMESEDALVILATAERYKVAISWFWVNDWRSQMALLIWRTTSSILSG